LGDCAPAPPFRLPLPPQPGGDYIDPATLPPGRATRTIPAEGKDFP
jgi:hypothetical protein